MNILICEDNILIIFTRINHINNYYILFNFNIILFIRFYIKQKIISKNSIFILTRSHLTILIEYIILLIGDNFLFELIEDYIILFTIVINSLFHVVLIRNTSDKSTHLMKNFV